MKHEKSIINSKTKEAFLLFGICFVLVTVSFGKLFNGGGKIFFYPDVIQSDTLHYNLPVRTFLHESLRRFSLPLWSKEMGTGYPLFAEGQIGTLAVTNLILYFFLEPWLALNFSYIISFILVFFGTYILYRSLRFEVLSSVFASVVFSYSGYLVSHFGHPNLLQVASLMPLIFYFSEKAFEKQNYKNYIFLIFILTQAFFYGHIETFAVVVVFCIIFYTAQLTRGSQDFLLKQVTIIGLICLLFILLIMPQLTETIKILIASPRSGTFLQADRGALLKDLVLLINPEHYGNRTDGSSFSNPESFRLGNIAEHISYIGILPLFLVVLGIFTKRKKLLRAFLIILFISLVLVFRLHSPLWFVSRFPIFSFVKTATRFYLIVTFALTGVATLGFQKALRNNSFSKRINNILGIAIIVFCFIELFSYYEKHTPLIGVNKYQTIPETVSEIPKSSRICTDVSHFETYNKFVKKYGFMGKNNIDDYVYFLNGMNGNYNMLMGYTQINSYSAIPLTRDYVLKEKINPVFISGCEYLISTVKHDEKYFDLIKTVNKAEEGFPQYYVYRNTAYLPRIRLVDRYNYQKIEFSARTVKSPLDFGENNTYTDTVIAERSFDDEFKTTHNDSYKLISDQNGFTKIQTITQSTALLALSDQYFPGWVATINGESTKIYPGNINQRLVVVPEGENIIDFTYKPRFFATQFGLSVATFILLTVLFSNTKARKKIDLILREYIQGKTIK